MHVESSHCTNASENVWVEFHNGVLLQAQLTQNESSTPHVINVSKFYCNRSWSHRKIEYMNNVISVFINHIICHMLNHMARSTHVEVEILFISCTSEHIHFELPVFSTDGSPRSFIFFFYVQTLVLSLIIIS